MLDAYSTPKSIWKCLKNDSYDLYQVMTTASRSDAAVNKELLDEWRKVVKKLNCSLTKYQRAVDASEARLRLELELLKQSMSNDILDREATFTQTLETIRTFELKSNDASSSKDARFAENSVIRALNSVGMINSTMAGLTDDTTPSYHGAARADKEAKNETREDRSEMMMDEQKV